ncbi:MAG: hypothetical protein D6767_04750 [Candidatus Hydrogenedentota bacterium]|nr:MAG: hypothetical protein D6767_04750 [Candidatus Hydrogenedentota bacterium]
MRKILLLSLLVPIFFACKSNKVLAQYENGKVTEKDLQELVDIFNLSSQAKSIQWKKQAARQLVVNELLSEKAKKEGMDKLPAAKTMKHYLRMYLIRMNTEKQWEDESLKGPFKLYKARHILRKVKYFKQVKQGGVEKSIRLSEAEKKAESKSVFEEVAKLREKIKSGQTTFEKAARELSEDPESKVKGGDLGHFPEGTMVPEFQRALYRLAGEVSYQKLYRVLSDQAKVLTKPEANATILLPLEEGFLLAVQDDATPFLKVAVKPNEIGYVKKALAKEETEKETKELSLPVKTMYGWHLIQLEKVENVARDKYIEYVAKEKFTNQPNAYKNAEQFVDQQIRRSAAFYKEKKENELMKKYGLKPSLMPKLPPQWEKATVLWEANGLKISGKEYLDYLKAQEAFAGTDFSSLKKNPAQYKKWAESNFQKYVELKIFEKEFGKSQNQEKLNRQVELSFKPYLARLYKIKFWYKDVKEASQAQIQKEYDELKQRAGKRPFPPMADVRDALKRRLENREKRNIDKVKEEALLRSVKFKLLDENFKS